MEERIVKCFGCSKLCIFYPEWNKEGTNLYCHKKGNYIKESDIYDNNMLKSKEDVLKEEQFNKLRMRGVSRFLK